MTERHDVIVVGGGPVGLATAIHARLAGLSVLVLEAGRPPADRACGEGLLPSGRLALNTMGIQRGDASGVPFRGIRFIDGGHEVEADFPAGKRGLGLRRTELHRALRRRLEDLGGVVRWGCRVHGMRDGVVLAEQESCVAETVIAADGRASLMRRLAGWETVRHRSGRIGLRRHFRIRPWTDRVEVHWADGGETYVTPVAEDVVGVAFLTSERRPSFDDLGTRFPALADRLRTAEPLTPVKGATGFGGGATTVIGPRLAVVGDAARCLDPITGEGLSLGFADAEAVIRAVVSGDQEGYRRHVVRSRRVPRCIEAGLLGLQRYGRVRRTLFAAPGRHCVMAALVAVHVGGP
jgi:flavin-dependent dehydrogenase